MSRENPKYHAHTHRPGGTDPLEIEALHVVPVTSLISDECPVTVDSPQVTSAILGWNFEFESPEFVVDITTVFESNDTIEITTPGIYWCEYSSQLGITGGGAGDDDYFEWWTFFQKHGSSIVSFSWAEGMNSTVADGDSMRWAAGSFGYPGSRMRMFTIMQGLSGNTHEQTGRLRIYRLGEAPS